MLTQRLAQRLERPEGSLCSCRPPAVSPVLPITRPALTRNRSQAVGVATRDSFVAPLVALFLQPQDFMLARPVSARKYFVPSCVTSN